MLRFLTVGCVDGSLWFTLGALISRNALYQIDREAGKLAIVSGPLKSDNQMTQVQMS